ncbi:hypothetical protein [Streptomyces sp. B3I8]|uniref:hypothetical protein n=1 Tax=Streptomyces sp. B3I8 TaxID=3042303 RepID=UPI0027877486|nr:hypothetical protein [Streptomyces sp. B3I8]MDQ0789519.1 hypothetical protein [Streptomyces sp. B3I8]
MTASNDHGTSKAVPPSGRNATPLDALAGHGIPRDRIRSERTSTRALVRPAFEEALKTAREVKTYAAHCRVVFTAYVMKRPGRDAAGFTVPADHLTAHGRPAESHDGSPPLSAAPAPASSTDSVA